MNQDDIFTDIDSLGYGDDEYYEDEDYIDGNSPWEYSDNISITINSGFGYGGFGWYNPYRFNRWGYGGFNNWNIGWGGFYDPWYGGYYGGFNNYWGYGGFYNPWYSNYGGYYGFGYGGYYNRYNRYNGYYGNRFYGNQ